MSTDYTSCSGEGCPIKDKCHRFTGPKEPLWQSYFVEIPGNWEDEEPIQDGNAVVDVIVKSWKCEMFWGETQTSILNQLKDIVK